jgi:RNA polymerase sigma-70 factor, ECF subfamily
MKNILATFTETYPKEEGIDWQEVYEHTLPRMFHYFCYKVGDPIIAEELTSITLEKAWKGRSNFRKDIGQFQAWLVGIARNVASDYFQNRTKEISLDEIAESDLTSSFDDDVQRKLEYLTILTILSRFPDREKELIAMKYGAELTNREIARIIGLSESNVGTILHRVVNKLRIEWEKNHE